MIKTFTPSPVFNGLPAYLKDPANYLKVKKLVIESLAGTHSHGEVVDWAKCAACQRRFSERNDVLKKLGFRSSAQYMAWQKVHDQIKSMKRDKLRKYNDPAGTD